MFFCFKAAAATNFFFPSLDCCCFDTLSLTRCESSQFRTKYNNVHSLVPQIKNTCSILLFHKSKRDMLLWKMCEWSLNIFSWCLSNPAESKKKKNKMKTRPNKQAKYDACTFAYIAAILLVLFSFIQTIGVYNFFFSILPCLAYELLPSSLVSIFFLFILLLPNLNFALWLLFRTVQHINL